MQEEVEQKSLMLSVNATKFTGRVFKAAITRYLAHVKEQKHEKQQGVRHFGKQTVKQLVGQNQGVSNVELNDSSIRNFERVARKYGVDYAIKRVKGSDKYLVFFKSRDADALNAALSEYANRRVKQQDRPSLLAKLRDAAALVTNLAPNREKRKERGAR